MWLPHPGLRSLETTRMCLPHPGLRSLEGTRMWLPHPSRFWEGGNQTLGGGVQDSFSATYQILQILSAGLTIGCPALHWNACENSGMFTTTPLIRSCGGECGFVMVNSRIISGRTFAQ